MELLDEVGNADVADLLTVKNFIVHFQLKAEADCVDDPVPVEIEALGDDTYEMLRERVYPVYSKVSAEIVDALPNIGRCFLMAETYVPYPIFMRCTQRDARYCA